MIITCFDNIRFTQKRAVYTESPIHIGRSPDCELTLDNSNLSDVTLILTKTKDQWMVRMCGITNIVELNEKNLSLNHGYPLKSGDRLKIKPIYDLVIEIPVEHKKSTKEILDELNTSVTSLAQNIHQLILERMRQDYHLMNDEEKEVNETQLQSVEKGIEEIARTEGLFEPKYKNVADYLAGLSVYDFAQHKNNTELEGTSETSLYGKRSFNKMVTSNPRMEDELKEVAARMEAMLGMQASMVYEEKMQILEDRFWPLWKEKFVSKIHQELCHYLALKYIKKTLKDILFGYGPLEDLLRMPLITEIMVVNYETIYIEKMGHLENSGRRFFSDEITQTIISRIVARVNRRIDKSQPLVDARLSDGSRVNAIISPIAVSGSCLTIRRFPEKRLTIDDMKKDRKKDREIVKASITESAAEFLRASILARKNILVSGGTGTGKTTLLNCLCDYIPNDERIVTIEDTAELQINKSHVVRLESKEANAEKEGGYTIRDLVKNALRMRPDRIIVGECRGGEALDMLQAMNTGHDGSLTTVHANTAEDAVQRLEVLVQMAANLPVVSIHRQIVSAIDIIVQLRRMKNGRRCVTQIAEVSDMDPENGEIVLRNIFKLEDDSDDNADLMPTGSLPLFMSTLIERNLISLEKFYL